MSLIIRKATKKDATSCLKISDLPELMVADDFKADESYFEDAAEMGVFLVAEEKNEQTNNKEILGLVLGFKLTTKDVLLDLLVVKEDTRGRGIGTKLMQAFREELRLIGYKDYILFAPDESKKTHDFYKKLGLKGGKKKTVIFYEEL